MIHHTDPFLGESDVDVSSGSVDSIESLRRKLEEERRLRFELQHRVANNLMGLVGLIDRVGRTVDAPERRLDYIRDRVRALMSAHQVLSQMDEGTINLRELIEQLIPAAAPGQVVIECPDVLFSASRGVKLALVINEWFLNSTKYGALTSPQGTVSIQFTHETSTDQVLGTWRERGGPSIAQHPQPGLGTTLLCELVEKDLGGTVQLEYPADGAAHELSLVRDPRSQPCACSA